jgi:hypothetical protein
VKPPPIKPPIKPAVSIRSTTFAKLKEHAERHRTTPGRVVDEIIAKFLDEQERTS